jgi:hypothetical protein
MNQHCAAAIFLLSQSFYCHVSGSVDRIRIPKYTIVYIYAHFVILYLSQKKVESNFIRDGIRIWAFWKKRRIRTKRIRSTPSITSFHLSACVSQAAQPVYPSHYLESPQPQSSPLKVIVATSATFRSQSRNTLFSGEGVNPAISYLNRLRIIYTATFQAMGHFPQRCCCPLTKGGVYGNHSQVNRL